ncbi:MAG TPA: hypothetical protein VJ399_00390 [Patescibacteria group bacterium]|nr:hypothetical protein [Patescibacteria group bacterium]
MSKAENNTQTAVRFIDSWKKNPQRLESELLSLHNETNRKKDIYSFKITQEGLIDSKTNRLVKDFISRNTPTQKLEYEIFENLETWAMTSDEGIMLWISPPSDEYPCAKAIFSRIVYDLEGNKDLLNSAILFGDETTNCSDIIPSLPENNKNKIRNTLLCIDENDEKLFSQIIKKIENYTHINSEDITSENIHQAKIFTQMIEKGVSPFVIVQKMKETEFLGQYSVSCPPKFSAMNIMLSNSKILNFVNYEFKPGVCRVCKQNTQVGPCSICKECEKTFV